MAAPISENNLIHRIVALEERLKQSESWARKVNRRLKALEVAPAPAGPAPPVVPAGQELLEGEDDEEPAPAPAVPPEPGELSAATFITTYGPLDVWRARAEAGEPPELEDDSPA